MSKLVQSCHNNNASYNLCQHRNYINEINEVNSPLIITVAIGIVLYHSDFCSQQATTVAKEIASKILKTNRCYLGNFELNDYDIHDFEYEYIVQCAISKS